MAEVAAGQELEEVLHLQTSENLRNPVFEKRAYIDFIAGCIGGTSFMLLWLS